MKNTTSANVWTFAADTITVNGHTFPATYSLAKSGDVYVFATVKADAAEMPVRLHITASMPMYTEAAAAAEAARKASKAEPAPVQEAAAPAAEPVPVQEVAAPAAKSAPAKKSRKVSKAEPAPVQEAAAPAAEPVPMQEVAAPAAKSAPVEKAWIGTAIRGKGWSITFDAAAGRTRVQVEGAPTDAQRSAIEQAGFYWSAKMGSWNKGLTCKAYRAANALAGTLNALA